MHAADGVSIGSCARVGLHKHRAGLGLAFGAMGIAAASQTLTVLLLRYITDSIAVSAAIASMLIAISHFYDALIDPSIGHISDRTQTRWGRRRPFLAISSVVMPLCLILIFNAPRLDNVQLLIGYLLLLLLLHATATSMYKVPYTATSTELSNDYHTRSRLMAFRVAGNSIGLMLGSTIPAWSLAHWGSAHAGYGHMSWLIAGVVFVCCLAGTLLLPKEGDQRHCEPPVSLIESALLAWKNKPFRIICAAHACFMIGVATVSTSNAFFTRYVLQASDAWLGAFYVIMVVSSLAAIPVWLRLSRRYDKKPTYIGALALYSVMHLTWLSAGLDEPIETRALRVVAIGFALGGVMLIGFSMMADVIRYDAKLTGQRREATLCGIQSIIDRVFAVVGIVLIGVLLSALGYVTSRDNVLSEQPASAILALYISFSIVPALTGFISIALLSRYKLTAAQLDAMPDAALSETPESVATNPAAITAPPPAAESVRESPAFSSRLQ